MSNVLFNIQRIMSYLMMFMIFTMTGIFILHSSVNAGDTLNRIKSRGDLRCGVSEGIQGFSIKDADGRWTGMDADFCRALSAAVLGDAQKVNYFPLKTSERFPSLKSGEIDVLVRNTTWTLERETTLEVIFAGILLYDSQSFLVPANSGIHELSQLNEKTICVVKSTTDEINLGDYFRGKKWTYQPLVLDSHPKAWEAFMEGRCEAITSERPQLSGLKLKAPGGPQSYLILPEGISKEPLGPVVRRGDDEWFSLVRTVLYLLVRAEELGVSRENIHSVFIDSPDPAMKRWMEVDGTIARALQIPSGWSKRVIETTGNYGEIFERNLGMQSVLKLDRGLNRLYTQGGLMYAPPFR
jgi:general L-amino acid transport system substrate-binding protein